MCQCPIPFAFLRRRLKFLILLLIAAALTVYGLIKKDHLPAVGEAGGRLRKYVLKEKQRVLNAKDEAITQESETSREHPQKEILSSCRQNYPPEAETDYNTFELYKQIAQQHGMIDQTFSIPKNSTDKLKVFVVPMTHVDPGWLRTFASYSKDTNSILDNMLTFLKTHPKMRFIWCEVVFLERWWRTLNETQKADVKKLVESGQLEIASGSWVMTDEANPYFAASVDNIVEGQQFIFNELNAKPRVIWSNDPFGYGPTVPYLFTKTGIDKAVINRIHHGMKNHLQSKRAIPFKWRQHFDPPGKSDVFTQVLPYTHYDILNSCGPSPSACCEFDFKRITHYNCPGPKPVPITKDNVEEKAKRLEEQLKQMSNLYESNALLVMWGDDFRYDMIEEWYQQYDNLMPLFDQINSGTSTEIRSGHNLSAEHLMPYHLDL